MSEMITIDPTSTVFSKDDHELTINGVVSVPESITADDFTNKFIEWVEGNGWSFGGGIGPYED